jgi:hypothetical protein
VREWHNVSLQGLELLVTVLLARNREPSPAVAAGVPHAELAAELISLPSGLLAKVCEAIVKLKVCLGAACVLHACMSLGCMGKVVVKCL